MASRRYAAAADTFDHAAAVLKNNGGVQVCHVFQEAIHKQSARILEQYIECSLNKKTLLERKVVILFLLACHMFALLLYQLLTTDNLFWNFIYTYLGISNFSMCDWPLINYYHVDTTSLKV